MASIKSNTLLTSLLILVALFRVALGGTVHKVGNSSGWTMSNVNYEAWTSSRTFKVGDSLVFEYNNDFHDVTEVTRNDFELCDSSKPLAKYQTGSDTIILIKPGYKNFICGVPGHCKIGQKLQIFVLPASLGPVAAPIRRTVRSPSISSWPPSPINSPQYQMGPSPAPHSSSSISIVWIGFIIFVLLSLLILG